MKKKKQNNDKKQNKNYIKKKQTKKQPKTQYKKKNHLLIADVVEALDHQGDSADSLSRYDACLSKSTLLLLQYPVRLSYIKSIFRVFVPDCNVLLIARVMVLS